LTAAADARRQSVGTRGGCAQQANAHVLQHLQSCEALPAQADAGEAADGERAAVLYAAWFGLCAVQAGTSVEVAAAVDAASQPHVAEALARAAASLIGHVLFPLLPEAPVLRAQLVAPV